MKKIIQLSILASLVIALTNCQPILKAPAATIFSATLPTPVLDSVQKDSYPLANYNLTVSDLDGNKVSMETYKGKVIFLNFWATWCMPCVAELPRSLSDLKIPQKFHILVL